MRPFLAIAFAIMRFLLPVAFDGQASPQSTGAHTTYAGTIALGAVQTACRVSGPVSISLDSVGPLPTAVSLADLLKICPGVRTVRETEEEQFPALEFRIGELKILASQWGDSLALREPARIWEITGAGGVLPMGQPINAPWVTLRKAYGRAVAKTVDENVTVMFCKFPWMFLDLDATLAAVGPIVREEDQSEIPDSAKVVRIIIGREPVLGWRCQGGQPRD